MKNIKPCPYCDGEVEMVKLIPKLKDKTEEVYRIECKRCHKVVARGLKFDIETDEEGEERIEQYKSEMVRLYPPMTKG